MHTTPGELTGLIHSCDQYWSFVRSTRTGGSNDVSSRWVFLGLPFGAGSRRAVDWGDFLAGLFDRNSGSSRFRTWRQTPIS